MFIIAEGINRDKSAMPAEKLLQKGIQASFDYYGIPTWVIGNTLRILPSGFKSSRA